MITFRHRSTNQLTLWGKLSVWLAVALVAMLAWLGADPAAHAFFHRHAPLDQAHLHPSILAALHRAASHAHDSLPAQDACDHGSCVICAFAAGCADVAVFAALWMLCRRVILGIVSAVTRAKPEVALYRHAPSCGPP